jgi:hypothetical protein
MGMPPFVRNSIAAEVAMLISSQKESLPGYGLSGTDHLLEDSCHAHCDYRFRPSLYRPGFRRYRSPIDATRGTDERPHAHLSAAHLRRRPVNQSGGVVGDA